MAYILFPGPVLSDCECCLEMGYLTAPALARLYGVDYSACQVVYREEPTSVAQYQKRPGDIELHPRITGHYPMANITEATG